MKRYKRFYELGYTLTLKRSVYTAYNLKTKHNVVGMDLNELYNYISKSLQNSKSVL
jgi:hypothetical protein